MKKIIYPVILFIISLAYALSLLQSKPVTAGVIFGLLIATGVVYVLRWYVRNHRSNN